MSEWEPIETAPKDGTKILGHIIRPTAIGEIYFETVNKVWVFVNAFNDGVNPTHWMPLPKPPSDPNQCN